MFLSLRFKREAQKRSSHFSPELLTTSAAQTDFDGSAAQRSRILSCAYRSSSLKLRIWDRCSSLYERVFYLFSSLLIFDKQNDIFRHKSWVLMNFSIFFTVFINFDLFLYNLEKKFYRSFARIQGIQNFNPWLVLKNSK